MKKFWINCKAYRVDVVLVLRIDANQFGNLVSGASIYLRILSLPGVLKTGLAEIKSSTLQAICQSIICLTKAVML